MKTALTLTLLIAMLATNANASNTCNTLIAATDGGEISLKTYEIEVKQNGKTVMKEKKNMFNTDTLACGGDYMVYVKLMDDGKILKTRTRTFHAIAANKILINME